MGATLDPQKGAGELLAGRFGVPRVRLGLPIGIRQTDLFFEALSGIAGTALPAKHEAERGRLVDGYIDAHKYLAGCRAVVYGEEDLVVGLAAFLTEVGVSPVLCGSGGRSKRLAAAVAIRLPRMPWCGTGSTSSSWRRRPANCGPSCSSAAARATPWRGSWGSPGAPSGSRSTTAWEPPRTAYGLPRTQDLFDQLVNLLIAEQDADPTGYTNI